MTNWVRFRHQDQNGFGALSGESSVVHHGDMFDAPKANGTTLALSEVELLAPCVPSKIVALWNNFHALAAKLDKPEPPEPLYLLKAPTTVASPNAVVQKPAWYDGKVVYEGELAIVIGKTCRAVPVAEADDFILGYTCVNDITAADILNKDPTFQQWARAKGFGDCHRRRSCQADGAHHSQWRGAAALQNFGYDLLGAGTGQQDFP